MEMKALSLLYPAALSNWEFIQQQSRQTDAKVDDF